MNNDNYKEVYDKYFRLARKIAWDYLADYYLSGDIAQDVFEELYLKREGLDKELIKSWIILNTRRRVIDQKRRGYHKNEICSTFTVEDLQCGNLINGLNFEPEKFVLKKEKMSYQWSALESLREYNPRWYEILIVLYVEHMDTKELARELGITVEYLRVQVSRARKWLEKKVEEKYRED